MSSLSPPPPWCAACVVLCDADGCLFPSEEPAFEASARTTNAMLAALGANIRFTAEELRLASTGRNFRASAPALAERYARSLAPEELERWVGAELDEVSAYLAQELSPHREVIESLSLLSRAHVLAAVT